MSSIVSWDARTLSAAIHRREVSCVEVMSAYRQHIDTLNPRYRAIVNLAEPEAMLAQAAQCDAELARGHSRGWLHGIPQAIKDTGHALGFPTTYGCELLKNAVASQDSLITARMKADGCLVVGKTNMPEFGLGSHTFNTLFGATPNAWDDQVSAGGSSGGAAVALALRLLPVADGSDFMGSLRNPAAWNHVWGLRPSQGRVPFLPSPDVWVGQLGTEGPMARTVWDLAKLLSTQAGWDARAPLSIAQGPTDFTAGLEQARLRGARVAWLGDLAGHLATEAGILSGCERALAQMAAAGAEVEHVARPPFDPEAVWQAWLAWRRALVGPRVAPVMQLPNAEKLVKPEAQWELAQARSMSAMDFLQASAVRSAFYQAFRSLFDRYDLVALPCAQVWPFPLAQRWPQSIAGRSMDTYHRWMEVTLYATFAGLPALSAPAGFDEQGRWPLGLQLIGKPQGDHALLQWAAAYEREVAVAFERQPEVLASLSVTGLGRP